MCVFCLLSIGFVAATVKFCLRRECEPRRRQETPHAGRAERTGHCLDCVEQHACLVFGEIAISRFCRCRWLVCLFLSLILLCFSCVYVSQVCLFLCVFFKTSEFQQKYEDFICVIE